MTKNPFLSEYLKPENMARRRAESEAAGKRNLDLIQSSWEDYDKQCVKDAMSAHGVRIEVANLRARLDRRTTKSKKG